MGYGYKTYTYLNGKCYFSDDNYEGNCPINFKSKRKEKSSDSEDKWSYNGIDKMRLPLNNRKY